MSKIPKTLRYHRAHEAIEAAKPQYSGNNWLYIIYCLCYFVMILSPFRSWTIQTDVTRQSQEAPAQVSKCRYCQSIVAGLVICFVYCYAFVALEYVVQPITGLYHDYIEKIPVYVAPLVSPLIFFLVNYFHNNEVSKLSVWTICTMYACVAIITYAFGIINTLLFFVTASISLHMAYGRTTAWQRWFFLIFTIYFCCKAVMKFLPQSLGVFPPLWNAILYIVMFAIYGKIAAALFFSKTILSNGDYRERFFQRGTAQVQLQYIKQQWRIFLLVMPLAAICTIGQFYHPSVTHETSDTMGHIFCKVDSVNKPECLVNVTYDAPIHSNAEKNYTDDDSEWDYCGMLMFFCEKIYCDSIYSHSHIHTTDRGMARQTSARRI